MWLSASPWKPWIMGDRGGEEVGRSSGLGKAGLRWGRLDLGGNSQVPSLDYRCQALPSPQSAWVCVSECSLSELEGLWPLMWTDWGLDEGGAGGVGADLSWMASLRNISHCNFVLAALIPNLWGPSWFFVLCYPGNNHPRFQKRPR